MDELTDGAIPAGKYSYRMHVATHAFLLPESELLGSWLRSRAIAAQLGGFGLEKLILR